MHRKMAAAPIICTITTLTILTMLSGCGAKLGSDSTENTRPIITDVIVPEQIVLELKVDGHDADGDKLTYSWEVDQGELDSTTKRAVKWRLPSDARSATFKVSASDGVNEPVAVMRAIKLNLKNVPPVIERFVIPESVITGERIQLEAEVIDPDGDSLAFNWNAEVGPLSSSTSETPTWTAPIEGVLAPVELSVHDGINEPVVKSTSIKVIGPPLIVPGMQVAGIRLGDSFDNVKALYGEPDPPRGDMSYFSYRSMRVGGEIDGINLVESLFIHKPNKSKTAAGVSIGSDRKQVEAEFGPAEDIKEDEDSRAHWYWRRGIMFDYDEDSKVERIHVFKPRRWR